MGGDRRTPARAEELRAAGCAAGLDVVEVASAEPFVDVRRDLEQRKAAGSARRHGVHLPAAGALHRPRGRAARRRRAGGRRAQLPRRRRRSTPRGPPIAGRVARYAWDDHYAHLKTGLKAVAAVLKEHGWRARVLADDNAMVDRAAAHRAGIGWWGKNANLLLPGLGSWYVLGCVVTDAPIAATSTPVEDRCGSCRRCLDGCPTGAITAPGVVDARRCLSWLLQAEGSFPLEHRVALGDRIYGCDECQEVCPPNRRAPERDAHRRRRSRGPTSSTLLDDDDEVVLARAGRWYIPRRDVRYVRRNALVVLGNVGDGADPAVIEPPRPLPGARRSAPPGPCRLGGPPPRTRGSAPADRAGDRSHGPCRAGRPRLMTHLFVTNDFPPKVGGIQTMLWELWRRLDPSSFAVLTTPYDGDRAWDADAAVPGGPHAARRCSCPPRRSPGGSTSSPTRSARRTWCSTRRCRSAWSARGCGTPTPWCSTAPRSPCPAACPARTSCCGRCSEAPGS